ncbi:diguanylate cyclase domain-containing protein [Pelomonas sp. Root1237]|uniref:diguanylate cyclase domain-containing protein n=1 Tax=Pelomonas sp. Root1237 TaxID=1736434 RepID=UPI0009E7EC8A|nr:diguanylate cyclase [Pelomonas sp. Root1237]
MMLPAPDSWPTQLDTRHSLLLVDDDAASVQVLARMLSGLGELRFALSGEDGLRLARESPPDLVLVDAEMPGLSGFEVCAALRADPRLADVPVIIITGHTEVAVEVAGFAAGASDFIRKPPVAEVVVARARTQLRLKALGDALRASALTDGLTGLANRRRFDQDLRLECERARRGHESLALLLIDVDHFKRYNDRYGHVAGDACLREIAAAIRGCIRRPADLAARYGGEEFAVLLPQTDAAGARAMAQRIVNAVADLALAHADATPSCLVSVSVGWAAARPDLDASVVLTRGESLVEAADRGLYAAKAAGRGRIGEASEAHAHA